MKKKNIYLATNLRSFFHKLAIDLLQNQHIHLPPQLVTHMHIDNTYDIDFHACLLTLTVHLS